MTLPSLSESHTVCINVLVDAILTIRPNPQKGAIARDIKNDFEKENAITPKPKMNPLIAIKVTRNGTFFREARKKAPTSEPAPDAPRRVP